MRQVGFRVECPPTQSWEKLRMAVATTLFMSQVHGVQRRTKLLHPSFATAPQRFPLTLGGGC